MPWLVLGPVLLRDVSCGDERGKDGVEPCSLRVLGVSEAASRNLEKMARQRQGLSPCMRHRGDDAALISELAM